MRLGVVVCVPVRIYNPFNVARFNIYHVNPIGEMLRGFFDKRRISWLMETS